MRDPDPPSFFKNLFHVLVFQNTEHIFTSKSRKGSGAEILGAKGQCQIRVNIKSVQYVWEKKKRDENKKGKCAAAVPVPQDPKITKTKRRSRLAELPRNDRLHL